MSLAERYLSGKLDCKRYIPARNTLHLLNCFDQSMLGPEITTIDRGVKITTYYKKRIPWQTHVKRDMFFESKKYAVRKKSVLKDTTIGHIEKLTKRLVLFWYYPEAN